MSKKDLAATVSAVLGVNQKKAEEAVTMIFNEIQGRALLGQKVRIAGFGTFELKETAERQGRNPQTGEPITIAAKNTVRFKFSKAAEGGING